jgi:hypothetical protein
LRSLIAGLTMPDDETLETMVARCAYATTPAACRIVFLFWTGISIFAWAYVMDVAAERDPKGRVTAVCGGLVFAALAPGRIFWPDASRPSARARVRSSSTVSAIRACAPPARP